MSSFICFMHIPSDFDVIAAVIAAAALSLLFEAFNDMLFDFVIQYT